jgi:hypothetical protein
VDDEANGYWFTRLESCTMGISPADPGVGKYAVELVYVVGSVDRPSDPAFGLEPPTAQEWQQQAAWRRARLASNSQPGKE